MSNHIPQTTKTYVGEKEMRHGVAHMQRQGWQVASQSSFQPLPGCMNRLMLGGMFRKPKPHFTVTFTQPQIAQGPSVVFMQPQPQQFGQPAQMPYANAPASPAPSPAGAAIVSVGKQLWAKYQEQKRPTQ